MLQICSDIIKVNLAKDLDVLLCSLAACHASVHPPGASAERPAGVHFRCSHSIHARVDSPLDGPGSVRSVSPHLSCHISGGPAQISEALISAKSLPLDLACIYRVQLFNLDWLTN